MSRGHGGQRIPGEKVKNVRETLRRLIRYLRPFRFRLLFVLLATILGTAFTILAPMVIGLTITEIFEGAYSKLQGTTEAGIDFLQVGKMLIFLTMLHVFSSFFMFFQQYLMASVAQKLVYQLREDIFEKLGLLPLRYYDEHAHGDTLSRVTNDIDLIGTTLQQSLTQFIQSAITIIGILIMMFVISPILTLIALVSLPISIFVIQPFLKRSQANFQKQQKELGNLNGHIEEVYSAHSIVKAFNQEEKMRHTFDEINERLFEAGSKAQFISGIIMPIMNFIGNLTYVLISIVGGIFVTKGTISIGDIQAFITYVRQFSQPLNQTANIANIIQSTLAAAERNFELLDELEEEPTKVKEQLSKAKGHIQFENVAFGYDEHLLMENVSFSVEKGQKIAIVGPTGAGKTTLINLLMRFYEINDGKILIDGKDIKHVSRKQLRENFGMVLQETWLFNGTIYDNIAYGRKDASESEVYAAAKAAYVDHFIRGLPNGYETILNEEGSNISEGQRQLLTIARAILKDAPIMILDEATSKVDTRTEILIQEAMENLLEGRTSFVIAHRLSTIQDADLILVMESGSIIEKGTHEELLEAKGFYSELYYSQFSNDEVS